MSPSATEQPKLTLCSQGDALMCLTSAHAMPMQSHNAQLRQHSASARTQRCVLFSYSLDEPSLAGVLATRPHSPNTLTSMEYVVSALGAPKETASGRRDGYSVLGLSTTPSHSQ